VAVSPAAGRYARFPANASDRDLELLAIDAHGAVAAAGAAPRHPGDCGRAPETACHRATIPAIYGSHMNGATKTTVYLDADDYLRLKRIARREGRKTAELVREAVAEYARKRGRAAPRSVGAGRSGKGDLSERAEALLRGLGRRR
jgi:hypothetical protein